MKKTSLRAISLLLVLCMMFGFLPAGMLSFAADNELPESYPTPNAVVVAASDFQQNAGHSASDSVMEGIIAAMKAGGVTDVDGAIFCGDYSNNYTASDSGTGLSLVYGNYNTAWGLTYDDIVFVQGNHDPKTTSNLDPSGANDPTSGEYGVFVIHEDDYGWASGDYGKSEGEIKATADNLKTYLDAKLAAEFDKPIFVASHLPLHYSMRTYNDGDARYAQYIFDVLNDAAVAGLNIIYLYGHNHSQSFENYHGGGAVFYSAGDEILIGDTTNQKTHHTETINFTYMNAGFTGRFDSEDTADPTNTGTVFKIYDDYVEITRYDANGTHNLKSAGVQSKKYSTEASLYAPNTRVEGSPQEIELQLFNPRVPDTTVTDASNTGITVAAPGITGVMVSVNNVPNFDTTKYSAYVSYDIKVDGYTPGTTATVTIPVPDSFDPAKSVVVLDQGNVIARVSIVDGKITFTTNHFSVYDIAQFAVDEVTNWVEIPGDSRTIFRLTNSLTTDKKYVIVSSNQVGSATATNLNNNNNINTVPVTVIADTEGNYIEAPATTAQWIYNNSQKFQNVNSATRYLRGISSALGTTTLSFQSYTSWIYNDSSYGLRASSGNSYRYMNSVTTTSTSSNTNRVYIYEEETLTLPGGYAGMTGQTEYYLVTGRYADQAAVVAMIKGNITVYTATDNSGTDATETTDYQITGTVNPGTADIYTLTVTYGGKTLGTITVEVADKTATSLVVDPMEGSVERGSKSTVLTGSTMTVTYDDGTSEIIPVTVGMLSGYLNITKNGTYTDLSITYAGMTVEGYTLNVVDVSGNNFPTYPEGGSVKVDKTATGQDFQNTGVSRVELSVSGLPSTKGVDVIVMLDTSSSMNSNNVDDGSQTRAAALREALANLVTQLQADGPDGNPLDIQIAIADFNGYYVSNTQVTRPYNLETKDHLKGTTVKSNTDNFGAEIYTGNGTLSAGAFVDVHDINGQTVANALNFQSGTNYDYAFDAVYQLGEAIRTANEEERDLYVIFMSDGAPFQYNYFSSQSEYNAGGTLWNHWLTGTVVDSDWDDKTHSYFYNPEGKHWMAEAIKGAVNQDYTVIRKNAPSSSFIDVTGDGVADNYMTTLPGLNATMYSIGFCAEKDDNEIKATSIQYILRNIASDPSLYFTANDGDDLNGIFTNITDSIRYAAQNAVFEDQMGSAYDLQINPSIPKSDGSTTTDISTDITVTSYSIYTSAQVGTTVNGHLVTADDVGKTYGNSTVLETVSFSVDTNGIITATSTAKSGNILVDGIICAANFFYNTTTSTKTITLASGSTYELPGETFYWNIGTINEKQYTLSYAVVLVGALDGKVPEGSLATNNYAILSYTNWLGNEVSQSVSSPTMAWGGANVSYAFYLVDENGNPLAADGHTTTNIINAYKVTQPVLYQSVNLNAGAVILSTVAERVLPTGYVLYDANATYTVNVASGSGNSKWEIAGEHPTSTYVTGYAGAQDYSNTASVNDPTYDYTHTTVYFAVVWTIGTVPDTVVIDFGLPVDISVLTNDMFGGLGTLVGVGAEVNNSGALATSYTGTYGTAEIVNGKVRYTLNSMKMDAPEVFTYAVYYTGTTNPGYYYGTVTVIPATTVYFEDSFLTLKGYSTDGTEIPDAWIQEGTTVSGATQGEDRPGSYSRPEFDVNNIYGFDGAYTNMSTFSMGSAAKITVDANSYGTATFTFYGTGFDVVSMTSSQTGVLIAQVYSGNSTAGAPVKTLLVDTYYGYTKAEDGTWITTSETDNALYQIPVIKVDDLDYGQYTVKITASYYDALNNNRVENNEGKEVGDGSYDLYLDAIRIYNPTGNLSDVANEAYKADGEGWPVFTELRNNIISAGTFNGTENDSVSGAVFIDGVGSTSTISDYISYGPNNELYLAKNQSIAFNVATNEYVADVQLGIKGANGGSVTFTINGVGKSITTTTDMYYSIKDYASGTVVITNTGDVILSLTNIKVTYTQNPETIAAPTSLLWMDVSTATYALMSLRSISADDTQTETPDVEVTEPEVTEPEVTEPEVTEPAVTEPAVTEPAVTEPEEDVPAGSNTVADLIDTISNAIKRILGWLFH